MKKELIEKLNPANLTIQDAPAINALGIEELETLGKTYPANVNFLEVKNNETDVKFNTTYRAMIWHKKNFPNASFEVVGIIPIGGNMIPQPVPAMIPQKVEPPKALVKEEPVAETTEVAKETEEDTATAETTKEVAEVETAKPVVETKEEKKVEPPKAKNTKRKNAKNKRK